MAAASIILAYFSPLGCKLPEQHFMTTLRMCVDSGAEVCVAQVVQSGQSPIDTEGAAHSITFESDDLIFYKENLWNLAAQKATTDKLIFLDSDVYFNCTDWLNRVCDTLDEYDIAQPFDTAYWETEDGQLDSQMIRPSWTKAIANNEPLDFKTHHPGFGYAMTRQAHLDVGGFYEFGSIGNGDALFSVAIAPEILLHSMIKAIRQAAESKRDGYWYWNYKPYAAPTWIDYRSRCQALDLKIGYPKHCDLYHRWHGARKNRNYTGRVKYLDWKEANPPVERREDGLVQWTTEQPRVVEWWQGRDDDGKSKGRKPLKFKPE